MWISLNIINRMVDTSGIDPEEMALRLTMSTAEIDSIERMNTHLTKVIAAAITRISPHPNADKLTLVDCSTGTATHRVVCGATNIKAGDIVPLALPGTVLSEGFTIEKTVIRGEGSEGMLCSERELGISEDHTGIMILPSGTKPGTPLSELFPHRVDVRFEIDNKSITHRPDLWSHEGFAREIAALFGRPFTSVVDMSLTDTLEDRLPLTVRILDPNAAPRYSGLAVTGIKVEESPDWLKAMVTAIGMRPINNIVDITNYVMVELGEPMHAFDRNKLRGTEIIVRTARQGEVVITLDGQSLTLCEEDIVIADAGGPIALAGVMGGGNSEIQDDTTDIVLEAANFNPVNIRKTANRYNMRTEAAMRFEKSLSPENTVPALLRCYQLIREIIPTAKAASRIIDAYPAKQKRVTIKTSTDFIRKRLGHSVDDKRIIEILSSLAFKVTGPPSDCRIEVPFYRSTKDVSIPEDIVEEVGRIYGYDNIPPSAPMVPCVSPSPNQFRLFERTVKQILTGHFNMTEVSLYSFTGSDVLNRLGVNHDRELRLRNPLSSEQDRLRMSLVPGMVTAVAFNARHTDTFRIYELGRTYHKERREDPSLAAERTMVTGAAYDKKPSSPLFYEAKRAALGLLQRLRIREWSIQPASSSLPPYAHPGRSGIVLVGKRPAGLIFEIHPATLERFDIQGEVAMFDLDLTACYEIGGMPAAFTEISKYPSVPFEVSVIADERRYAKEICDLLLSAGIDLIQSVSVVSVYKGDPIPRGKKSVSLRIIFSSPERTLSPEEIEHLQKQVIERLGRAGFPLR